MMSNKDKAQREQHQPTAGSDKGEDRAAALDIARHECGEAAFTVTSVAGEEDPGAATEDIVEDIARHEREFRHPDESK